MTIKNQKNIPLCLFILLIGLSSVGWSNYGELVQRGTDYIENNLTGDETSQYVADYILHPRIGRGMTHAERIFDQKFRDRVGDHDLIELIRYNSYADLSIYTPAQLAEIRQIIKEMRVRTIGGHISSGKDGMNAFLQDSDLYFSQVIDSNLSSLKFRNWKTGQSGESSRDADYEDLYEATDSIIRTIKETGDQILYHWSETTSGAVFFKEPSANYGPFIRVSNSELSAAGIPLPANTGTTMSQITQNYDGQTSLTTSGRRITLSEIANPFYRHNSRGNVPISYATGQNRSRPAAEGLSIGGVIMRDSTGTLYPIGYDARGGDGEEWGIIIVGNAISINNTPPVISIIIETI